MKKILFAAAMVLAFAVSASASHSGAQGLIRVSVQKDQAVICTMIGENPELMEIARSVKLK